MKYKKDGTFPPQAGCCILCECNNEEGDEIHDHGDNYVCDKCNFDLENSELLYKK